MNRDAVSMLDVSNSSEEGAEEMPTILESVADDWVVGYYYCIQVWFADASLPSLSSRNRSCIISYYAIA